MNALPDGPDQDLPEPANLRFLRRLVTVLTATMILGMVVVVTLLALRINQPAPVLTTLPAQISLPGGASALSFTAGPDWFAVVTDANEILIYAPDGTLRQTVEIE